MAEKGRWKLVRQTLSMVPITTTICCGVRTVRRDIDSSRF